MKGIRPVLQSNLDEKFQEKHCCIFIIRDICRFVRMRRFGCDYQCLKAILEIIEAYENFFIKEE